MGSDNDIIEGEFYIDEEGCEKPEKRAQSSVPADEEGYFVDADGKKRRDNRTPPMTEDGAIMMPPPPKK